MIPKTPEWPTLAFTPGLNIGATGFGWVVAGTEGLEWAANPAGAFGVDYGPSLGPGGPDTEIFCLTAAAFPGNVRMLSVPNAALEPLVDGWVAEVVVEGPVPAVEAPSVTIGCAGTTGAFAIGGMGKVEFAPGPNIWQVSIWEFGTGWVLLNILTLAYPFSVKIVRNAGETAYRLYVDGVYQGEREEGNLAANLDWLFMGNPRVGVMCESTNVGALFHITSWLVGPAGIRPVANAGPDKVLPLNRILGFDGGASYDPDDGDLTYAWKLVRAPSGSVHVYEGTGAIGGSSITFVSAGITTEVAVGDILLIEGEEYEITGTLPPNTVYVDRALPAGYAGPFVVALQSLVVGPTTRFFAFAPDLVGLYVARLVVVDDAGLYSSADLAVANVVGSTVPMRVPLDMGFLWSYLADFWRTVENREWATDVWVALARIVGSQLQDLWNIDFDKSLQTTQNVVMRRWLEYPPRLDFNKADAPVFVSRLRSMLGDTRYTQAMIDGLILPFDFTFTLTFYLSTGAVVVPITAPMNTVVKDVPAVLNAGFAAAGYPNVHFQFREIEEELPTVPMVAQFKMTCVSPDCYTEIGVVPAFFTATSNVFRGTYGLVVGDRTVRLSPGPTFPAPDGDLDLDGIVKVGDILNLGGRSFNIVAVSNYRTVDPTTGLPAWPYYKYLEVEVDGDLPAGIYYWAIPSYWKTVVTDWKAEGLTPGDRVYFDRRPVTDPSGPSTLVAVDCYGAGADKLCTTAAAMFYADYVYTPSYAHRYFYLPTDASVLSVPTLQEAPESPTWIMQEFLHYIVDERRDGRYVVLNHREEPVNEMLTGWVRDRTGPVDSAEFLPEQLWAEITHVDNRDTIEANFGRRVAAWVADYAAADSNYLSIVTGLWLVYSQGPTPLNIERAVGIISSVPYAEAAGTILDLVQDFLPGRTFMLIRDTDQSSVVRSYVFPTGSGPSINPATGVAYTIGDSVPRFALLVSTQLYFDYIDDPEWWVGLRSIGVITEPEKIHKFGVFLDARYANMALVAPVINFVLDFKKTHTYPIFALLQRLTTTIEISDLVETTVTLCLKTHLWDHAAPPILDYPRLGSGVRVSTAGTGTRNEDLIFRMATSGDSGYTIALRAAAALNATAVGNALTLEFVRGVTTSAAAMAFWNLLPAPWNKVVALLPVGSTGLGTIDDEFGPVHANHRGLYQVHIDDEASGAALDDFTCSIEDWSLGVNTVIDGNYGAAHNIIDVVTTTGFYHQIKVDVATWHQFCDASIPAQTDIIASTHWLIFYTPAGVYRTEGRVVGVLGPSAGFWNDGSDSWVDVEIDPALAAPQVGDWFAVYRGPPVGRVMDWMTNGPIAANADIFLGPLVGDNEITGSVVNPAHPDYQISVAGGAAPVPRFFYTVAVGWSVLRPNIDYFMYYDANGSFLGIAELLSVDGVNDVTVRVRPTTNAQPPVGGYFVVVRRPLHTDMTPDYIRHFSAFGLGIDGQFLKQTVSV
jgi:hypothetical protein